MISSVIRLNPDDTRLHSLLKSVDFFCYNPSSYTWFGIEENGELCGIGALHITYDGSACLYNGVVDEKHRRKGIHSQLLTARLEYAKEKGCDTAYVGVYSDNEVCKASLIKHGFQQSDETYWAVSWKPGIETWYKHVA